MTFEEFFQKKRIDLTSLQAGEPALFFEFKTHFEQMGEKSFDHTKKYWFNKLRLQYHLSPEQKPEKMHLENRLAEQTIVETLTDSIPVPSKVGFKPRFNAAVVEPKAETPPPVEIKAEEEPPTDTAAPKPAGFKPRFNPKMVATKPEVTEDKIEETLPPESATPEIPAEPTAPKPAGFKPRFNPKMVAPKPEAIEEKANEPAKPDGSTPEVPAEEIAPKPAGFKPRFNAKLMAPKPEVDEVKIEEASQPGNIATEIPAELTTPKPAGFKPRFNAKNMAPKLAEVERSNPEITEPVAETAMVSVTETSAEPGISTEEATPKPIGFKPRFNAAKMKPKSPPGE